MKLDYYLITLYIIGAVFGISQISFYNVMKKEHQIIASVIAAEACEENVIGMYAVANVIKNRAIKNNKTFYEIVIQPNQFYGYTNPNRDKIYQSCKNTSDYLVRHLESLIDITDEALYYLLPNESRRAWHKIKTVTIKNHTFYR